MKTHILCLGDSNTHGYCADPNDCADHGIRFNEEERWTCRLQKALGDEYLVTEEGLSGRTTVFVDPIHESMDAPQRHLCPAQEPRGHRPAHHHAGHERCEGALWCQCRLHCCRHGAAHPQSKERGLLGHQAAQHSGGGTSSHRRRLPRRCDGRWLCGKNLPVWQSSSASSASGRACTSWTQRTASSTRWTSCT